MLRVRATSSEVGFTHEEFLRGTRYTGGRGRGVERPAQVNAVYIGVDIGWWKGEKGVGGGGQGRWVGSVRVLLLLCWKAQKHTCSQFPNLVELSNSVAGRSDVTCSEDLTGPALITREMESDSARRRACVRLHTAWRYPSRLVPSISRISRRATFRRRCGQCTCQAPSSSSAPCWPFEGNDNDVRRDINAGTRRRCVLVPGPSFGCLRAEPRQGFLGADIVCLGPTSFSFSLHHDS